MEIQGSFALLRMTNALVESCKSRRSGWEEKYAYVYMLANGYKKLYIGVTTQIEIRLQQHKRKVDPHCHTARYNITQLVYYERFVSITAAIVREKQLKGWLRVRKLELIIGTNPLWKDLGADWGKQMVPFDDARTSCTGTVDLSHVNCGGRWNRGILHFVQDDGSKFS